MGFFSDKIGVPLFMIGVRTKRIARSAVRGKLNYKARRFAPYIIGTMIFLWTLFVFSI
jgi:hypothetical protein